MKPGAFEDEFFPKGVYIITARQGDLQGGMTASWVCRASARPPIMMAAISRRSYTGGLVKASQAFAVNLIGRDQVGLARHFGLKTGHREDKLAAVATLASSAGRPVLEDSLGFMDCLVTADYEVGDHLVFFGEIIEVKLFKGGEPLMFHPADYKKAGDKI